MRKTTAVLKKALFINGGKAGIRRLPFVSLTAGRPAANTESRRCALSRLADFRNLLAPFESDFFQMAERQGFEPWEPLPVHTLSRRARSTAPAPFRNSYFRPNGGLCGSDEKKAATDLPTLFRERRESLLRGDSGGHLPQY